jgi:hypothetical protein
MPGMRLAKPDDEDFDTTRQFLQLCEGLWDCRERYSFSREETERKKWDEDDTDYLECLRIRKILAADEDISEKEVDDRLILYELIKSRYKKCDTNWGRVIMTAVTLLDNVCDPTLDYVEFYPGFECFHVAPEQ